MKNIILFICALVFFIVLYLNIRKIPSMREHINRNQYNIFPRGTLIHSVDNKYIDEAGMIWIKRGFLHRLLHNPFKYYVFESYDPHREYSFEVEAVKEDFDKGIQKFRFGTFNFYSSITHPISHMFADVLPIIIYLAPKYT